MNTYKIIACDGNEYTVKATDIVYFDRNVVSLLDNDQNIMGIVSLTNIISINLVDNSITDEMREYFERRTFKELTNE